MVDFLVAVPYGIAIGTGIVAFAYMIGSLLQSDAMKSWSRLELGELVVSAILVVLVAEALSPAGQAGIIKAFTGVSMGIDELQSRMYVYMELPLEKVTEAVAISSMHLSRIISYNYNYQLPIPYFSPTGSSSPGAGAGPLQLSVMIGMDSTALNLMLVHAVKLVFVFLIFLLGTFFMPLGIILRFIPPLRKIGSMLLGTGLAVYLVFPIAIFWGTSLLAFSVSPPDYDAGRLVQDPGRPPTSGFVCSTVTSALYSAGEQIPAWIIGGIVCIPTIITGGYVACVGTPGSPPTYGGGVAGIVAYLMWLFQYGFPIATTQSLKSAGDTLTPDFVSSGVYQPMVGYLLPLAVVRNLAVLFIVILALAATIILARQFAQVLGAEGQFYGLTKLV